SSPQALPKLSPSSPLSPLPSPLVVPLPPCLIYLFSYSMSTPSLAAKSALPALSVAVGLPLCHNHVAVAGAGTLSASGVGATGRHDSHSMPDEAPVAARSRNASYSESPKTPREEFAQRAKNSVSRIYARRMINRARLERQHPWASSAVVDLSGSPESYGGERMIAGRIPENEQADSGGRKTQGWKDKVLSETLLSIIGLHEKKNKLFKSIAISCDPVRNDSLSQSGILRNDFPPTFRHVALCESMSAKQRTLNEYNSLDATKKKNDDSAKPAEWSDDINLVQRRLEFGKEISPLSNTTRFQRWSMAIKRMVTLGVLAAPLGVMIPANFILGNFAGEPKEESDRKRSEDAPPKNEGSQLSALQRYHQNLTQASWDYALWAIETAGPTYIKLVQWASTRNDLFSPEFVGHFSKLQDETRGHSWIETERSLERAFGKDWRNVLTFDREILDEDDKSDGAEGGRLKRKGGIANRARQKRLQRNETKSNDNSSSASMPTIPIGSGCIAQVYKAQLRSSHGLHPAGTSIAVKVQHPNILEKVCLDFYLMNKLASVLEYIPYLNLDYLSMKDSVDQFRDIMLPQLDLRVEAHNLQRFRRDFEGESQIAFPEPLVSLTSREVLVERFVEGE
ncbi:hypothetical protein ACHAWF_006805, partial [Thalassiosira exigua]